MDQEAEVLESFSSKTRDKAAALTLMKKLMKGHGRVAGARRIGLASPARTPVSGDELALD